MPKSERSDFGRLLYIHLKHSLNMCHFSICSNYKICKAAPYFVLSGFRIDEQNAALINCLFWTCLFDVSTKVKKSRVVLSALQKVKLEAIFAVIYGRKSFLINAREVGNKSVVIKYLQCFKFLDKNSRGIT